MTTSRHPADSHDLIRVIGARENNLKDISVELPKRRLTVFTGVSGSGKSSLVFSTIAEPAYRKRYLAEGAAAFVDKSCELEQLALAVQAASHHAVR